MSITIVQVMFEKSKLRSSSILSHQRFDLSSLKEKVIVLDYLVGTGGWAYFIVPKAVLKTYSEVFNFVEVGHTLYDYPDLQRVESCGELCRLTFRFQSLASGLKPSHRFEA